MDDNTIDEFIKKNKEYKDIDTVKAVVYLQYLINIGLFTEVIPNVIVVKYEEDRNAFSTYLWKYKSGSGKFGSAKSP